MGMLVEGEWLADDERYRRSDDGAFVRPGSAFRAFVTADYVWLRRTLLRPGRVRASRLHQSPEMASRRSRLDFRLATCRQSSSILGAAGHTGVGVGDASGSRPAGGVDQNRIKAARLA
jgi:hypothetical protein